MIQTDLLKYSKVPFKFWMVIFLMMTVAIRETNAGGPTQPLTTACPAFMDTSVLSRSTSYGEEQVMPGNYQGLAQQYNGLSGSMKGVWFRARVNPNGVNSANTVKVVVYNVNQGLPGTIIGTQNVVITAAAASYDVLATFSSPLSVNGSVIISIEPFSPSTDNFFIERNTPPDGQFLNLIKIKQANQWFKNLAAGDPNFDYDFMIVPFITSNLTASFTHNTVSNTTSFTNNSTGAANYSWDFGDGSNSTAVNPTHNFAATGTYNVKLNAYKQGINTCVDSITIPVTVTITSLQEYTQSTGLLLSSTIFTDEITLEASQETTAMIVDGTGREMAEFYLRKGEKQSIDARSWNPGMYLIRTGDAQAIRIMKLKSR